MATNMPAENGTDDHTDEKFITGIDTRLKINKTDSQNKKLQSLGFLSFLEEVQTELNAAVAVFIEVNDHDVQQLTADKTDINTLFADNEHYPDFVDLVARTKADIEHWVAEDNPEPLAHQAIVDQVIGLRVFIEARYTNLTTEPEVQLGKRKVSHYLGAGIVFLPIVFAWLTLRKGYSNWLRIGAFIWLGVFLYFTMPSPREELQPAPSVTEALPASEAPSSSYQQEPEQDSEPRIAR
ncbi:hypothetical protein [Oceanisphaera sp. IT1-181]|uniref:hypothetical protein n=1 Tax=Oceanisphaera sp. IT1-181 TaxID=3081199 RepID=UPI0029C9F706|nr:hypothetical protein [Oceanisphaera sp. IT1-181]